MNKKNNKAEYTTVMVKLPNHIFKAAKVAFASRDVPPKTWQSLLEDSVRKFVLRELKNEK